MGVESMKKYENGKYVKMTKAEIEEMKAKMPQPPVLTYEERVNAAIRERYTVSQEFAILRQRDEKPEEFKEYYAYCEACKAKAKEETQ